MTGRVVKLSIGGRETTVDLHTPETAAQTLGTLCAKDTVARNEHARWPKPKPLGERAGNGHWLGGGSDGGASGGWGGGDGGGYGDGGGGGSCGSDGGGCGGH